jgi:uncharacterized integral membrane protein
MENITVSTVGTAWFIGFVVAILLIIILNVISQNIDTNYYNKIFCGF